MSCCTNTLDLGCVGACEAFELPIKPSVSELWTIELTLLGITLTKEYQTTAGQSILINISEYELNENTCIIINVKDENGNIVINNTLPSEIGDHTINYDCFKIKTIIKR